MTNKALKTQHYDGSESYDFGVSAAVCQENEGHIYVPEVLQFHFHWGACDAHDRIRPEAEAGNGKVEDKGKQEASLGAEGSTAISTKVARSQRSHNI